MTSEDEIEVDQSFISHMNTLKQKIAQTDGIAEVNLTLRQKMAETGQLPRGFLSDSGQAVKFSVILKGNPYSQSALDVVKQLRQQKEALLSASGFAPEQMSLHYAGQTATQLDIRQMNRHDMIVVFSIITVLIALMLMLQSGSVVMGLTMIFTMLLSYAASLGFSWFVLDHLLGYGDISYRLPFYAFVFLISLGVDYNIILVSRIREDIGHHFWKEAISQGVHHTGGVITSAGVILAGTFTVLMTQPIEVLFTFGLTMGIGILIDTFIVRGMLLPAILTFLRPKQVKDAAVSESTDDKATGHQSL